MERKVSTGGGEGGYSWPYFRPKHANFHTRFQTSKSIRVSRPDVAVTNFSTCFQCCSVIKLRSHQCRSQELVKFRQLKGYILVTSLSLLFNLELNRQISLYRRFHGSLENHTRIPWLSAPAEWSKSTKTAQKPEPLGRQKPISIYNPYIYIWEYPPSPGGQLSEFVLHCCRKKFQ